MLAALRGVDLSTTNSYVAVLKAAIVGACGSKYDGVECSNVKAALGGVDKIYSTDYALLSSCRI